MPDDRWRGTTALVATPLASKEGNGGHASLVLQYLIGLRRLGSDVLLCDRADHRLVDIASATAWADRVLAPVGLRDTWTLAVEHKGHEVARVGRSRAEVLDVLVGPTVLIDIMGFAGDGWVRNNVRHAVYVDIDPGFGQLWRELGLVDDTYEGYDAHFTVGSNLGTSDCTIPTHGIDWRFAPPPIVLDRWPVAPAVEAPRRLTSVASWRGAYDAVDYCNRRHGLRVHEFRRFIDLPQRVSLPLEVALAIDVADQPDRAALTEGGWCLADPGCVAADPDAYRRYIEGSFAEFGIAKEMYVATNSGWVSDRTACYLASGRPAIVQDTGQGKRFPIGAGLLTFATPEEAVACIEDVARNYTDHAEAARTIAVEHFNSDAVLTNMLIAGS